MSTFGQTFSGSHTVNGMRPNIGTRVMVRFESVNVECTVTDAKNSWGKVRLLIQPVTGNGAQWVELDRVTPVPRYRRKRAGRLMRETEL